MNIFGYIKESINEGDGLRSVIFVSGCHGLCEGCHNPESWSMDYGHTFTDKMKDNLIKDLKANTLLRGVTYCGGEPFLHPETLSSLTKEIKQEIPHFNFWSYTGYTFEQILKDKDKKKLLDVIDVLIDGRFILSKKDLTQKYRGSSNQRIIDVQKSLDSGEVVLWKE